MRHAVLLVACLALWSAPRAQAKWGMWQTQHAGLPAGIANAQLRFVAVDSNTCWGISAHSDPGRGRFIRTTDGGRTWSSGTVPGAQNLESSSITAFDADRAWIVFSDPANGGGVYATTDRGATWSRQAEAFGTGGAPLFVKFFDDRTGLVVGNPNGGFWEIYTTSNGGTSWTRVPSGSIPAPLTGEIAFIGGVPSSYANNFWFTTNSQSLYKTSDRGLTRTVARDVYPAAVGMAIAFKDSLNGLLSGDPPAGAGFRRTTDGGATFTDAGKPAGLTSSFITYVPGTMGTYVATSHNFFPNWVGGSAFTIDDGATWTTIDTKNHGLAAFATPFCGWSGGGSDSLYRWSGDMFVNFWSEQASALPAGGTATRLQFAPIDSMVCWAAPVNDPQYRGLGIRTMDGGGDWQQFTVSGASSFVASSVSAVDAQHAWIAFAAESGTGGGVFATTDGGATWARQSSAFPAGGEPRFVRFFDTQNGLVVGNPNSGTWEIYTTGDGGATWIAVPASSVPAPLAGERAYLAGVPASYKNNFWFPTNRQSLYKTTDRGLTWTVARNAYPGAVGMGVAFKDSLNGLLSGGEPPNSGFRRTKDGGVTFTQVNKPEGLTCSFVTNVPGTKGTYVATSFDLFTNWVAGSAYTVDDGTTWTTIDTLNHGRAAFLSPDFGWSAGAGDILYAWDRLGSGRFVLPVTDTSPVVPADFALEQNYPNPFNPQTDIRFRIADGAHVRLAVYDLLGREVAVLVDEQRPAGSYQVKFDASGLSSGIYLYRLSAGELAQGKKMLLVR